MYVFFSSFFCTNLLEFESDLADSAFDYYNMDKGNDDNMDDDDEDADTDGEDDDDNVEIEDGNDRAHTSFRNGDGGAKSGNKRRKSTSEKNNRAAASSAKISSKQRKHEASNEETFEDEFIDRESEDLPVMLDDRYNPAPKRKKLNAQLLDSEVDLDSVLNSDGQVRSSAAARAAPASSSPTSSDNGGAAGNNFFTSSGRSDTITEIRRDSVCSPQEYEILKVRETSN